MLELDDAERTTRDTEYEWEFEEFLHGVQHALRWVAEGAWTQGLDRLHKEAIAINDGLIERGLLLDVDGDPHPHEMDPDDLMRDA